MITASNFRKAQKAIEDAAQVISIEIPASNFVLVRVDNDYIYFNVVARQHPSDIQIRNIKEKTGFEVISEVDGMIYKVECRMPL